MAGIGNGFAKAKTADCKKKKLYFALHDVILSDSEMVSLLWPLAPVLALSGVMKKRQLFERKSVYG